MRIFDKTFANFYVILPMIFAYILSIAIATFIENDYGTTTANELIYRTMWFNALHLYFFLAVIFSMIKILPTKKYAVMLFHFSFTIIILGSAITRFFAQEGIMHIRDSETSFRMNAADATLNIIALNHDKKSQSFHLKLPLFGGVPDEKITFFDKILHLKNFQILKNDDKNSEEVSVKFTATYDGVSHEYNIIGGKNVPANFAKKDYKDMSFYINYANRNILLPFGVKLNKFELQRYPGSMSPSSYNSNVSIIDNEKSNRFDYDIFMNNVLDYRGYRFYQSSYDNDELGTILSVNKDPGKLIVYVGYALLFIGALMMIFSKNGRFFQLSKYLQSMNQQTFNA